MPDTKPGHTPCALLVIASEQLWPNLASLLHFAGELTHLYILHTDSEPRSAAPSRRLARCCTHLYPRIVVERREVGITPQTVRSAVEDLWRECPDIERWWVNTSGGLKLMFGGLIDLISDRARFIYRELDDQWFELHHTESGALHAAPYDMPRGLAAAVPVRELVEMQFEAPPNSTWRSDEVQPLNVAEITRAGIELRWEWQEAFEQAGHGDIQDGAGFLFERFVAAIVRALGVDNVVLNLALGGVEALQEIDVVACTGDSLVIIDCKLSSAENSKIPRITQIDQAGRLGNKLGGVRSEIIMLRPSWPASGARAALARANRVHLWTQQEMPELVRRLADIFGFEKLPEALRLADVALQGQGDLDRSLFTYTSPIRRRLEAHENEPSMYSLTGLANELLMNSTRPWVGFEHGCELFLIHRMPPNPPPRPTIVKALAGPMREWVRASDRPGPKSKSYVGVHLEGSRIGISEAGKWLRRHVGKSLLTAQRPATISVNPERNHRKNANHSNRNLHGKIVEAQLQHLSKSKKSWKCSVSANGRKYTASVSRKDLPEARAHAGSIVKLEVVGFGNGYLKLRNPRSS